MNDNYIILKAEVRKEILAELETRSWLLSASFLKRAAGFFGYWLLVSVAVQVVLFVLLVLLGVLAGGGAAGVALRWVRCYWLT